LETNEKRKKSTSIFRETKIAQKRFFKLLVIRHILAVGVRLGVNDFNIKIIEEGDFWNLQKNMARLKFFF
jgi:hypothetical protein